MWSIDYIVETDEQCQSELGQSIETQITEPISLDPVSSVDIEQDKDRLSVQESEDAKSEGEVKSENESVDVKEELESGKREAAIKRVEALVKQMSLSHEQDGG